MRSRYISGTVRRRKRVRHFSGIALTGRDVDVDGMCESTRAVWVMMPHGHGQNKRRRKGGKRIGGGKTFRFLSAVARVSGSLYTKDAISRQETKERK